MNMQADKLILLAGVLGLSFATSGCTSGLDMSTPSQVNTGKIQVKEQEITETLAADHIDASSVAASAGRILQGNGKNITLTIPYRQGGYVNAVKIGNSYKTAFQEKALPGSPLLRFL